MSKPMDITNRVYGRLTAVKHLGKNASGSHHWLCKCECGNETTAVTAELNRGKVTSCGCYAKEQSSKRLSERNTKHGYTNDLEVRAEYFAWRDMKQRCQWEAHPQYKDWGGRGIKVCKEWQDDFAQFLADVGRKPDPSLSLDRIDNDGDYTPDNVRWADRYTQSNNRRCSLSKEGIAA